MTASILKNMSAAAMSGVLDALSDFVCVCVDGNMRHINASGRAMLGATNPHDLIDAPFQTLVSDDFVATVDDIITMLAEEPGATPMRIKGITGQMISLRLKVVPLPDLGDTAYVVLGQDITRQVELTDAIHQSQARFRKLVHSAMDLMCVMDDGKISYINAAGLKMLKVTDPDALIGQSLTNFLHPDYREILAGDIRELVAEDMLIPVRFIDAQQNMIDAEIAVTILDSGRGHNYMVEARDITAHNRAVTALRQSIDGLEHRVQERTRALQDEIAERRHAEDRLRHTATHDSLTNLPNRTLLLDHLNKAIARAKRNTNICAVLFLDLDGFKPINDTLGHDKGDVVLQQTAMRMLACVRGVDTVARFGGDEFVIVLSDIQHPDGAITVAKKILAALAQPIDLDGQQAQVGASIGIALYPNDGVDGNAVLKQADNAMYHVKENGKNDYAFPPRAKPPALKVVT